MPKCNWKCNEDVFIGNACRVHAAKILAESCDALSFLRMIAVIPCTPQGLEEDMCDPFEEPSE